MAQLLPTILENVAAWLDPVARVPLGEVHLYPIEVPFLPQVLAEDLWVPSQTYRLAHTHSE